MSWDEVWDVAAGMRCIGKPLVTEKKPPHFYLKAHFQTERKAGPSLDLEDLGITTDQNDTKMTMPYILEVHTKKGYRLRKSKQK